MAYPVLHTNVVIGLLKKCIEDLNPVLLNSESRLWLVVLLWTN